MPRLITGRMQAGSVCKNLPLRKLPSILKTALVPSEGSAHNDLITLFRTPLWMSPLFQCGHVGENVSITPMSTCWWLDSAHGLGGRHPSHIQIIAHPERHTEVQWEDCMRTNVTVFTGMWTWTKLLKHSFFKPFLDSLLLAQESLTFVMMPLTLPWYWASHCAANSEAEGWERTVKILWLWKL